MNCPIRFHNYVSYETQIFQQGSTTISKPRIDIARHNNIHNSPCRQIGKKAFHIFHIIGKVSFHCNAQDLWLVS